MKAQPGSRIEPHDPQQRTGGSEVTERIAGASPRARARITGVVYLLFFVTAILGEFFTRQGLAGYSLVYLATPQLQRTPSCRTKLHFGWVSHSA